MSTQSDPAQGAEAITPHDTNVIGITRGIYIGGAGDVALYSLDGNLVTFVGCLAGSVLPVVTKRVMSTNTSATNLIALY